MGNGEPLVVLQSPLAFGVTLTMEVMRHVSLMSEDRETERAGPQAPWRELGLISIRDGCGGRAHMCMLSEPSRWTPTAWERSFAAWK